MLIEGLGRYIGWWLGALVRWRDPRAPMSARRLTVLVAGMPVFLGVQLVHAICLVLDEILFPRYRRASLDGAVIITGIPRSGTTFLHRTLAADTDHYTTLTTWEAVLAPSIAQRCLVRALRRLDGGLGRPLGRGLAVVSRRLTAGLDAIHEIELDAAEEDYLALLPAAGCFVMLLALPSAPGLQDLGRVDRTMPAGRRRRLLRFYRGCLQRHVHADGGQRRLLSKNAAFGSWVASLRQALPEARFILCVREPAEALSSQLSAVRAAQTLFGTATDGAAFQQLFLDLYTTTLAGLARTLRDWPVDRAALVDLADMQAQPAAVIREAMRRLAMPAHQRRTRGRAGSPGRARAKRPSAQRRRAGPRRDDPRSAHDPELPAAAGLASPGSGDIVTRAAHEPRDAGAGLRVAFFSDSLPERNGTGAYYHDLLAHLRGQLAGVEIFQPLPGRDFETIGMPLPGDPTQRLALPARARIRRAMAELAPHVVVSVTPGPFGLLGRRLARARGAGFITAYHTDFAALAGLYWGPLRRRLGQRLLDALNRHLCRASATVLVNNNALVATAKRLGAPRVDVMGTPIEQVFLATTPPAAPRRPDPVVFAGRLAAEKNIDAILAAARARPQQRFIVAGDGPQRERVVAASRALDNLEYRGWLTRQALCELLDEAGVLVLPSHVETFGSIALEAMVRRRPVLVSASAGIHDWPQVADSLCRLAPDERLEDALARLAHEDPEQWAARGERGRVGALQLHRETVEQWLAVLSAHAKDVA
ncbi:MAG: sulfotransferase [Halofilum sp. (in: g-proteobacteria)]|nr:sulfotransferase [Halofilum sp. (in: g-proteobacteria)]